MPGVTGFWAALAGGETLQSLVPRERWDADAIYSTDAEPGKSYARFGAFLQVPSVRGFGSLSMIAGMVPYFRDAEAGNSYPRFGAFLQASFLKCEPRIVSVAPWI